MSAEPPAGDGSTGPAFTELLRSAAAKMQEGDPGAALVIVDGLIPRLTELPAPKRDRVEFAIRGSEGQCAARLGDWERALAADRRAEELWADVPVRDGVRAEVLTNLAGVQRQLGETRARGHTYDRLIDQLEASADPTARFHVIRALVIRGEDAAERGDIGAAADRLTRAAERLSAAAEPRERELALRAAAQCCWLAPGASGRCVAVLTAEVSAVPDFVAAQALLEPVLRAVSGLLASGGVASARQLSRALADVLIAQDDAPDFSALVAEIPDADSPEAAVAPALYARLREIASSAGETSEEAAVALIRDVITLDDGRTMVMVFNAELARSFLRSRGIDA